MVTDKRAALWQLLGPTFAPMSSESSSSAKRKSSFRALKAGCDSPVRMGGAEAR